MNCVKNTSKFRIKLQNACWIWIKTKSHIPIYSEFIISLAFWNVWEIYLMYVQKQPPDVFYRKRCSLKFHKIHRRTPVPGSRACNFIKKETLSQVPVNFTKCLRTPFLTEHLRWLLLYVIFTQSTKTISGILWLIFLLNSLKLLEISLQHY